MSGNPTSPEPRSSIGTAVSGDVRGLAEQLTAPDLEAPAAWPPSLAAVNSLESLDRFVTHHADEVLSAREWPVVLRAWQLAREGRARELVELDNEWGREVGRSEFAGASFRVGRRQLGKLRSLRHERVIQKYLTAVEEGRARGWHPVVYGVVLAVYNLPLRQGLTHFGAQTLGRLVTSVEQARRLPTAECQRILDAACERLARGLPELPPVAGVV
ncbi:MAG: hypothetical protein JNL10_19775 [Verrucomicrobiales bacterium]|nr:hypothetical protein [Verrucomicrobiales bacterium]